MVHKYQVGKVIDAGIAEAILAMPEGEFQAKDLPLPPGAGNRYMQFLAERDIIVRLRRDNRHRGIWRRGGAWEKWVAAIRSWG